MYYSKVFSLLFLLAFSWSCLAQNQQFKKADKLYKLNEYSQAISFYEQGLKEDENLSAKTKLAYCYKMTNNLNNAEQLYSEIVYEERARPITKYYYGETLMSNGKYAEAKNWFLKYAEDNPNDERAIGMAKACERVNIIKPMFENVEVEPFSQNSKSDDSGPVFYKEGIVFTSDRKSGINPMKQKSGWTGRDFLKIYYSEMDSSGVYQKPKDFSNKLNDLNKHCGPLTFNGEQNFVVFTRTGNSASKNDSYKMQLYYSESKDGKKWKKPKEIAFCKKDHNYMHPTLSSDGKTLYFVSDKPGGEGGTDIYKSKMTEKGWGTPLNLGTKVNSSANEGFPFIQENKLYFSSKGHDGFGGFDVFMVEKDEKGLWSKPYNLGSPVNSSNDDISFNLNADFTKAAFSSSRDGNDDNIYIFEITENSIINTKFEETEDIIVREPLKPTATNEVVVDTKSDTGDDAVPNQLKSESQNDEGANGIITPPDNSQFKSMSNDTDEPTDAMVIAGTAENSSADTENAEGFEDNISFENEMETTESTSEDFGETNIIENETTSENTGLVESEEIESFNETVVQESETNFENTELIVAESEISNQPDHEANEAEMEPTESEIIDKRKINIAPSTQANPNDSPLMPVLFKDRPMPEVFPMVQMKYLIKKGIDIKGKTFRINGIQFETGQYVITPEIALKLNLLIDVLEQYPELEVEIAAHTSSVGDDMENLEVSRARAGAIAAHLIDRGINDDRINAEGYGENRLLNKCANDIDCSQKQHNVNERVEIAIF